MHGINSMRNINYFNAGLQCISHCEALSIYFLSGRYHRDNLNSDNQKGFVKEYEKFISKMWMDNNCCSIIEPSLLRNKMDLFKHEPNNTSRCDSSQIIKNVLDNLSIQLNRSNSIQYFDNETNKGNTSISVWNSMLNKENSIITDLFYGIIHSELKCLNCNNITNKYEKFALLNIPIPVNPVIDNSTILSINFLGFNRFEFETVNLLIKNKMTLQELREINDQFCKGEFDVVKLNLKKTKVYIYQENEIIIDNSSFKDRTDNIDVFVIEKARNSVPIFVFFYKIIRDSEEKKDNFFFNLFSSFNNFCCTNESTDFDSQKKEIFKYPIILRKRENELTEFPLLKIECKKIINSLLVDNEGDELKDNIYYTYTNEIEDIKLGIEGVEHKSLNVYYQLAGKYNDIKEIINSLPLEGNKKIENKRKEITLEKCFNDTYCHPYYLQKCQKCESSQTEFTNYISKTPYYLCVKLNRFFIQKNKIMKNSAPISYKENLNVYDYLDDDLKQKYSRAFFDYELFSVNIHSGSVNGGSCYAYCKVGEQWYEFNDSIICHTNFYSPQAYILFYRKKQKDN